MADFFSENQPADTEAVKLGAARIREMRRRLNVWASSQLQALGESGAPTYLPGWVQSGMLAANSVTTAKIAPGAVMEDRLADGAVTTSKLAAQAVTTEKLAAGAVTADRLASTLDLSAKTLVLPPSATPVGSGQVYVITETPDTWRTYRLILSAPALGGYTELPRLVDLWAITLADTPLTHPGFSAPSGVEVTIPANTWIHHSALLRYFGTGFGTWEDGARGLVGPAFQLRMLAQPNPEIVIVRQFSRNSSEVWNSTTPQLVVFRRWPTSASVPSGAESHQYASIPMSAVRLVVTAQWWNATPVSVTTANGGQTE